MLFARRLDSLRQQHGGRLPFLDDAPPRDIRDLLGRLDTLASEPFDSAVQFISSLKYRSAVPVLLNLMCDGKADASETLAHAIATIGGRQACPGLTHILQESHPEHVRYAAVYGLTWIMDARALEPLLSVFTNPDEPAHIRAQAAEGLTYLVADSDTRTPAWRAVSQALQQGLNDTDTDVRFRSVFGLGALRARSALPRLRELAASDTAISPSMLWTIQEEARQAIAAIEGAGPQI